MNNPSLVRRHVNMAVRAQAWSTQRIIRELRPAVLATCAGISALLSDTTAGSLSLA